MLGGGLNESSHASCNFTSMDLQDRKPLFSRVEKMQILLVHYCKR